MYESGSLPSQFKPHQQGPKALPASVFGKATMPDAETVVARASYVLINVPHTTAYQFQYESGGAYVKSGLVATISNTPVRLDIRPIAWKGGAGTAGHVTFVYEGGF
jgi:hypothetical protein